MGFGLGWRGRLGTAARAPQALGADLAGPARGAVERVAHFAHQVLARKYAKAKPPPVTLPALF